MDIYWITIKDWHRYDLTEKWKYFLKKSTLESKTKFIWE
jgi:hypothetical protein